jgi:hypothetical protein
MPRDKAAEGLRLARRRRSRQFFVRCFVLHPPGYGWLIPACKIALLSCLYNPARNRGSF